MSSPTSAETCLSQNVRAAEESVDYRTRRKDLLVAEGKQVWDLKPRLEASEVEVQAADIVFKIREHERRDLELYGNLPSEAVPGPEVRDMGGQFLPNKSRIERSLVFDISRHMPKGCHLHIHFNTELPPELLLPHARRFKDTMFVRTTLPLLAKDDFEKAEVVFNVMPNTTTSADIFSMEYNPDVKAENANPWMRWADFRLSFPHDLVYEERPEGLDDAECWAREKMALTAERVYSDKQTTNGIWACFNQGTRAFKGLMNYESVYRWYIGEAITSMIRDRVMYAELRPMLMDKTIPSDDGLRQLDHSAQMKIICQEVKSKTKELEDRGELDKFPFGLKIIYCTPRSIPKARMQTELLDCIKLKQEFPDLICGFDLVGAEDRPNHIGFYCDLLVGFQKTCKDLDLDIPFMFHAGETLLDTGGSSDPAKSNLYDSLLLHCKRIGHGYSLLKHPLLIEKYKQQNICLELCPISNELLHLCGNIRQHPFPQLLAAGLHCTLNADNPSLFRGATTDSMSLSFEFYQMPTAMPLPDSAIPSNPPNLADKLPRLGTPRRKPQQQTSDESTSNPPPPTPSLPSPPELSDHAYLKPSRRILSEKDHQLFVESSTHELIVAFVFHLSDSVRDKTISDVAKSPAAEDAEVKALLSVLDEAQAILRRCPPVDTGSRFGNPAFRTFLEQVQESIPAWQRQLGVQDDASIDEVGTYLANAFGNGTRIDYGSGHELNFLLFLLCLNRLSLLPERTFPALALLVFPRYLRLMREVQSTYYLEPAGSHGVWGLDDYQFLPFLFGASQLVNHKHIRPLSIHNPLIIEECARDHLYLDQIAWVNETKTVKGLRWHSPMLDDISAAKNWAKIEA
ncbi:Phosphotyrosyl phosphatase activator, partial [Hortaea werneckii]